MKENAISVGDKKMRLLARVFGAPPADGRSLWISMHGGGGAPAEVNDQQWRNQVLERQGQAYTLYFTFLLPSCCASYSTTSKGRSGDTIRNGSDRGHIFSSQ